MKTVWLESLDDRKGIQQYMNQYNELPKIIGYKERVYICAPNLRKAKEIEEVFKFHLMVLDSQEQVVNHLASDEIMYLGNWDSEKYRQKL